MIRLIRCKDFLFICRPVPQDDVRALQEERGSNQSGLKQEGAAPDEDFQRSKQLQKFLDIVEECHKYKKCGLCPHRSFCDEHQEEIERAYNEYLDRLEKGEELLL